MKHFILCIVDFQQQICADIRPTYGVLFRLGVRRWRTLSNHSWLQIQSDFAHNPCFVLWLCDQRKIYCYVVSQHFLSNVHCFQNYRNVFYLSGPLVILNLASVTHPLRSLVDHW